MRTTFQGWAVSAVATAVVVGIVGCGGMSTRDKDTVIGAGLGAAGGAAVTGGSTLGTLGGAALGGVAGNQYGKNK